MYRLAADQGFPNALYNLGMHYNQGVGVPKDLTKSSKYFEAAAMRGHVNAMFNLAMAFDQGEGIPPDVNESYLWFKLAAMSGDEEAQKLISGFGKLITPLKIKQLNQRAYTLGNKIRATTESTHW